MRWPRSLITRILLAEAVTILVAAVLLPALLITVLHRTIVTYQDEILLTQARAVAAGLRVDSRGVLRVELTGALAPIYATGYDGRAFVIEDLTGRVLAASLYGRASPPLPARRLPIPSRFHIGWVVGVSLPTDTIAGRRWVIVSQDESGPGAILDDVSRDFLWRYVAVLLPILLLLPLINSLVIRRLVLRVRAVSLDAARIGADSLHVRLDETGMPAEVAPLVHATNRLLDRVETGFRQQGEFVANVAHELRTPLAALRVRLDAVEDLTARGLLDRQVERLSHVISQLRDLASLERFEVEHSERFDLHALAQETIAELAPTIFQHSHRIELAGGDGAVVVLGSRTLIGLALTNLIANALRHTPPGTAITVSLGVEGSVSVADDGPGVTSYGHEQLIRRFWRADLARSDSAGIGLSIVQRIMDVHHGAFLIGTPAGPGAVFTLQLQRSMTENS